MPRTDRARGFTLIELLVVMAIIGTLLSIAAPRYFEHVDRAKENTLRQDLDVMRDAIDKFHADTERYPADLRELVDRHYLKRIPVDPFTGLADSWRTQGAEGTDGAEGDEAGVADVHSGAEGAAHDGTAYGEL